MTKEIFIGRIYREFLYERAKIIHYYYYISVLLVEYCGLNQSILARYPSIAIEVIGVVVALTKLMTN